MIRSHLFVVTQVQMQLGHKEAAEMSLNERAIKKRTTHKKAFQWFKVSREFFLNWPPYFFMNFACHVTPV